MRRWYLLLVALLLTAGAAFAAIDTVGPTYQSEGAVLLIPPGTTVREAAASETLGNPLLSLGGLSQARDVVIRTLTANATFEELCTRSGDPAYLTMRDQLCRARPGVTYEVVPDFSSGAPIILITVEADSAANSVTALDAMMDLVPTTLADLQAELELRPRAAIVSLDIVADRIPEIVRKNQIRAGIVAGAGVLAVTLLLIGLLDGMMMARWARKRGAAILAAAAQAVEPIPVDQTVQQPGGLAAEPSGQDMWSWFPSAVDAVETDDRTHEGADEQAPETATDRQQAPRGVAGEAVSVDR